MMELSFLEVPATTTPTPLTPARSRGLAWIVAAIPSLILSSSASAICYRQTSVTLGLFLGPLVLSTIYTPPLMLGHSQWRPRLSIIVASIIGPAIVWLTVGDTLPIRQVLFCVLVLAAWLSLVSGATLLLFELRIVPILAATVIVVLSLMWLTWPIWLSPVLASHQRAVFWLCWGHPLMAINSVVRHLGLWGSPMGGSDLAYRYLTILNQDVAYPHSQSIWPCVFLDALLGLPALLVSFLVGSLRSRRQSNVSG